MATSVAPVQNVIPFILIKGYRGYLNMIHET
jgi:hypothetical protein